MNTETKQKTVKYTGIEFAEENYIECKNDTVIKWKGSLANKLQDSPDFEITSFTFSVWEITNDFYDWKTDCCKHVSILRANQSTLSGALKFMKENCVLVHNQDIPEETGAEV